MNGNFYLFVAFLNLFAGIFVTLTYKQWADSNLRQKHREEIEKLRDEHWKAMEKLRDDYRQEADATRGRREAERRFGLQPTAYKSTFPPSPYEYGQLEGTVKGVHADLDKLAKRIKQLEDGLQAGAA